MEDFENYFSGFDLFENELTYKEGIRAIVFDILSNEEIKVFDNSEDVVEGLKLLGII